MPVGAVGASEGDRSAVEQADQRRSRDTDESSRFLRGEFVGVSDAHLGDGRLEGFGDVFAEREFCQPRRPGNRDEVEDLIAVELKTTAHRAVTATTLISISSMGAMSGCQGSGSVSQILPLSPTVYRRSACQNATTSVTTKMAHAP